jgi:putative DNA primase/helicase
MSTNTTIYDPEILERMILRGILLNERFRKAVFEYKLVTFQNNSTEKIYMKLKKEFTEFGRFSGMDSLLGHFTEDRDTIKAEFMLIDALDFDPIANEALLVRETDKYLKIQAQKKLLVDSVNTLEEGNPTVEIFDKLRETESFVLSGSGFEQFSPAVDFLQVDLGEVSYHLFPIIGEASITMLCAARGTGKTLFAMYAADAIAKGQDFCCWENRSGPQRVLYFDGEVYHKEFQQRLRQMEPSQTLLTYCRTYSDMQGHKALLLSEESGRTEIKRFIIEQGIKFVVFDNLASLCVGIDENQKRDYDPINQFFLSLRGLGVSVMILHHTGKSGAQRGTSGREDNVDSIIQLVDRKEGAAEARFELYFEKFRGMVTAETKALVRKRELKCVQHDAGKWVWLFEEARLDRNPDFVAGVLAGKSQAELAALHNVTQYRVKSTVDMMIHQNIIQRSGSRRGVSYEITDKGREYYGDEWHVIEVKMIEL